jgi:hypothetical protein
LTQKVIGPFLILASLIKTYTESSLSSMNQKGTVGKIEKAIGAYSEREDDL